MITIATIAALIGAQHCFAETSYWFRSGEKRAILKMGTVDSVQISSECLKKNCIASQVLKANTKKLTIPRDTDPQGFALSPASMLCAKFGGNTILATDPNLNQLEFCHFADGSVLSITDLIAQRGTL